jgi:FkbM family methyltransferase
MSTRPAYLLTTNKLSDRTIFSQAVLEKIGFSVILVQHIPHHDNVISNKISMQSIYKLIKYGNDDYAYVFEDDINILEPIYIDEIIQYEKISDKFFYLGACTYEINLTQSMRPSAIINKHPVYTISGFVRGLHAVGFSKNGASEFLDYTMANNEPYVDILLEEFSCLYPANILRYDLESYYSGHRGIIYQERERFPGSVVEYNVDHIDGNRSIFKNKYGIDIDKKTVSRLLNYHTTLSLKHGSFAEEIPEQIMALQFLTGNEIVLEFGANIGRNSLIISRILKNSENLVVFESDKDIANQLQENKEINNCKFQIIDKVLSNTQLIQKGWSSIESNVLLPGYKWVDVISYDEFKLQYNMVFDTLVIDCEGAFYNILVNMIDILKHIKTILIENDFHDYTHKLYVDKVLKENNFKVIYSLPLMEYPGLFPDTRHEFYQVWRKE